MSTGNLDDGFDAAAVKEALDALLNVLPDQSASVADTLSNRKRSQLPEAVRRFLERLQRFHLSLDPIQHPLNVLDPSDPGVVGRLIADTFVRATICEG